MKIEKDTEVIQRFPDLADVSPGTCFTMPSSLGVWLVTEGCPEPGQRTVVRLDDGVMTILPDVTSVEIQPDARVVLK